jgi:complex III assembly factor LYRM7
MALAAYRHILRSARIAFQGTTSDPRTKQIEANILTSPGDPTRLTAAKAAARSGFLSNRSLTDQKEIEDSIQHARDVGTILQQNVVQGQYNEAKERYKLKIHEKIERGDNETIKAPPPLIRGRNTLKNAKVSTL